MSLFNISEQVFERDRRIINDDRVQIEKVDYFEPLPKSPYGDEDFGYQTIKDIHPSGLGLHRSFGGTRCDLVTYYILNMHYGNHLYYNNSSISKS